MSPALVRAVALSAVSTRLSRNYGAGGAISDLTARLSPKFFLVERVHYVPQAPAWKLRSESEPGERKPVGPPSFSEMPQQESAIHLRDDARGLTKWERS